MFKPIGQLATMDKVQAQADPASATTTVNRLFMLFHGWYGNLFISKFATGERDEAGKDKGIKSARLVWASELREFDAETVMEAAKRCKAMHIEYPPSLPQFVAICKAVRPSRAFPQQPTNRVGMSDELRSAYSKRIRDEATAKMRARMDAETGHIRVDDGLDGLKQLVAKAVALAGGDEAAELHRLDGLFARVGGMKNTKQQDEGGHEN